MEKTIPEKDAKPKNPIERKTQNLKTQSRGREMEALILVADISKAILGGVWFSTFFYYWSYFSYWVCESVQCWLEKLFQEDLSFVCQGR
jgi:hypothetical protein